MDKQEYNEFQKKLDSNYNEFTIARMKFEFELKNFGAASNHTVEEVQHLKQTYQRLTSFYKSIEEYHIQSSDMANSFYSYKDEAKILLSNENEKALKPYRQMQQVTHIGNNLTSSNLINVLDHKMMTESAIYELGLDIGNTINYTNSIFDKIESVNVNGEKIENVSISEFNQNAINELTESLGSLNSIMTNLHDKSISNCIYAEKFDGIKNIIDQENQFEINNYNSNHGLKKQAEITEFSMEAYDESRKLLRDHLDKLIDADKKVLTNKDYDMIQKLYDNYSRFSNVIIAKQENSADAVGLVKVNQEKVDATLESASDLNKKIAVGKLDDFRVTNTYVNLSEYGNNAKEVANKYSAEYDNRAKQTLEQLDYTRNLESMFDTQKLIYDIKDKFENQDLLVQNAIVATNNNERYVNRMLEISPDENLSKQIEDSKVSINNIEPIIESEVKQSNEAQLNEVNKKSNFNAIHQELNGLISNYIKDDAPLTVDQTKEIVDKINQLDMAAGTAFAAKAQTGRLARRKKKNGELKDILSADKELEKANLVTGEVLKNKNKVTSITRNPFDFPIAVNKKDKDKYNSLNRMIKDTFNDETLTKQEKLQRVQSFNQEKAQIVIKTKRDTVNNVKVVDAIDNIKNGQGGDGDGMQLSNGVRARVNPEGSISENKNGDKEAETQLFPNFEPTSNNKETANGIAAGQGDKIEKEQEQEQEQVNPQEEYKNKIAEVDDEYDKKETDAINARKQELQEELSLRDKKTTRMKGKGGKEVECTPLDKFYNARAKANWIFSIMTALLVLCLAFAPMALGPVFLICSGMAVYFNKILKDYRAVKTPLIEKLKKSHPDLYRKYGYNATKFINKCMQYNDHVLAGRITDLRTASLKLQFNKERQQAKDRINLNYKLADKEVKIEDNIPIITPQSNKNNDKSINAELDEIDGSIDGNAIVEDEHDVSNDQDESHETQQEDDKEVVSNNVDQDKDQNKDDQNKDDLVQDDQNKDDLVQDDQNKDDQNKDDLVQDDQNKDDQNKDDQNDLNKDDQNKDDQNKDDLTNNLNNTSTNTLNQNNVKEDTTLNLEDEGRERFF